MISVSIEEVKFECIVFNQTQSIRKIKKEIDRVSGRRFR